MTDHLKNIPLGRIRTIGFYIPLPGRYVRRTAKQTRDEVLSYLQDKQTRMTPWGVQFYHPDRNTWEPSFRYQNHPLICGKWIRDVEIPGQYSGHPLQCTCNGRPPPRFVINDTTPYRSGCVLSAFANGEVTDPSLDHAEPSRKMVIVEPESDRCMLTELPPDILELILIYLIPQGGYTYQFFPARLGTSALQLVQKFVPETSVPTEKPLRSVCPPGPFYRRGPHTHTHTAQSILDAIPKSPVTGSTHGVALAATCRYFQDLIYTRFYSNNAFIFHLTPSTVHNETRSSDFTKFRGWTRKLSGNPAALGPLTERAMSYMKDVTLVPSLPLSHGTRDIDALANLVQEAAQSLQSAKLERFSVHLNITRPPSGDNRHTITALPVDCLQVEVDQNRRLGVRVRNPEVEFARESSKAQRVLRPLLSGPRDVQEVVLSGPLSQVLVEELKRNLSSETPEEPHVDTALDGERPAKRRKI